MIVADRFEFDKRHTDGSWSVNIPITLASFLFSIILLRTEHQQNKRIAHSQVWEKKKRLFAIEHYHNSLNYLSQWHPIDGLHCIKWLGIVFIFALEIELENGYIFVPSQIIVISSSRLSRFDGFSNSFNCIKTHLRRYEQHRGKKKLPNQHIDVNFCILWYDNFHSFC